MATRNRTSQFRNHRDTLNDNRLPITSSRLFGGPVIEMAPMFRNSGPSYTPISTDDHGPSNSDAFTVGLHPAWVVHSEEVAANIQIARVKMAELVKVHAKALTPSFGDGKQDKCMIEALTQEITALVRSSEKRLHNLSPSGPSEDSNIRKNVQRSLATDLQNLSVELRKKQSTYLERLRQQNEHGLDLEMNENRYKFEDDAVSNLDYDDHHVAKLTKGEKFTAEREREIRQVLGSVNELAQIMKDLSVLVIDQGTIVDRIDHNIQNVAVSVEEGFKQLQKAERSQRNGGMVRCATVLVIMCFTMLVLLVLKEVLL